MANLERSGWRDEKLSAMHRLWGAKLLFTNIDSIWIECLEKKCIAFIEYKCETDIGEWQKEVLIDAARERPAFVVRYSKDYKTWKIAGLNSAARKFVPNPSIMTFAEFLCFQYRVRNIPVSEKEISEVIADMGWWAA